MSPHVGVPRLGGIVLQAVQGFRERTRTRCAPRQQCSDLHRIGGASLARCRDTSLVST